MRLDVDGKNLGGNEIFYVEKYEFDSLAEHCIAVRDFCGLRWALGMPDASEILMDLRRPAWSRSGQQPLALLILYSVQCYAGGECVITHLTTVETPYGRIKQLRRAGGPRCVWTHRLDVGSRLMRRSRAG